MTMGRLGATALILAASTAAAMAGEASPICSRPAVLAEIREALREAGRPIVFDPVPVAELSDTSGRLVTCAAQVHVTGYDSERYGQVPLQVPFVVRYALELRRNGIFLRLL